MGGDSNFGSQNGADATGGKGGDNGEKGKNNGDPHIVHGCLHVNLIAGLLPFACGVHASKNYGVSYVLFPERNMAISQHTRPTS